MGFVVNELYAFVCVDEDGDEGVLAATMGETLLPLVGADLERVTSLVPIADNISDAAGLPYKLLRFELAGEVNEEFIEQLRDFRKVAKPDDNEDN